MAGTKRKKGALVVMSIFKKAGVVDRNLKKSFQIFMSIHGRLLAVHKRAQQYRPSSFAERIRCMAQFFLDSEYFSYPMTQ